MSGESQFENLPTPSPEGPLTFAEKKKFLENLREFFKDSASEMREDGMPVNDQGRIDMDKFKGVYSVQELKGDKEYVEDLKDKFQRAKISEIESRGFLPGLKEKAIQEIKFGEACEMLVTAVLHKNLPEGFVALRSSEYDDIRNGVDTIILDKNTGNIVCALDEIASTKGERFDNKQNSALRSNLRGGGFVKYGLSFNKERTPQGKLEIKRGTMRNIPLFYGAFSREEIESALREFRPSRESSFAEQKIYSDFLGLVREQISKLDKGCLDRQLRRRLELFEKSVLELR